MKRIIFISILFIFINIFSTQYYPDDWTIYSLSSNITDMDADLKFVFVISNTGILTIDKFSDEIKPLLAYRNSMIDIPFFNLIVDKFNDYNIYFTGSHYIYHYDWFNDTLYYSTIEGIKAKNVSKIGLTNKNVYVQIGDSIYFANKYDISNWSIAKDTINIYWKINRSVKDTFMDYLPHYIYFNNRQYDFTVGYEDLNYIWFGTKGAGVYKVDKNTKEKTHLMIGPGSIKTKAMAMDSQNTIWMAGLNTIYITRYFPETNKFEYFPVKDIIEIPSNDISFISCSKNNVLFCTDIGELFFYSLKKKRFYEIKNENAELIFRACPLDKDRFVVSNEKGLAIVNTRNKKYYDTIVRMPAIIDLEVYKDSVYMVSQNTLYSASIKDFKFHKMQFDFPIFDVYNIFINDSAMIILDNAYIHIKRSNDSTFSSYPVRGLFGDFYTLTMDNKNIWIGGQDGIGRLFLKDKHFKHYYANNCPLSKYFTYSLISYKGYLYGVTGNNFFKFYYSNPMLHE